MTQEQLLHEIRARLHRAHGKRLLGVVLYGSGARGDADADADSDIDLLVLLDDVVDYGQDLETNLRALYPLALEIGRPISAKPISAQEYEAMDCPLYSEAHREGIAV